MNKLQAKIAEYNAPALFELLEAIDVQVATARAIARKTDNYETLQAINTVRIAIIEKLDAIDESYFSNYCAKKFN